MLIAAVMAAGAVAAVAAWWLVRAGRSIWIVFTLESAGVGLAALATGRVSLSPRVGAWVAALAGAGAGVAFYLATAGFVHVAQRYPAFDRHVADLYGERKGISLPTALLLASAISAPGEELFWRGLFQWRLAGPLGWVGAALVTWVASMAVYVLSGNLPIIAGAVVGGAVWGALALWTHGVLASVLCHAVWTALMLVAPPGRTARAVAQSPGHATS